MNQLYNQVSGHTVGYIGFITNYMANYLNAVAHALTVSWGQALASHRHWPLLQQPGEAVYWPE